MRAPSPADPPRPTPVEAKAPGALVVATFNTHAGVDGWGRPFDLEKACGSLDADVLVLQEVWGKGAGDAPGAPPTVPTQADQVADALGYQVVQVVLATVWRSPPRDTSSTRWTSAPGWRRGAHALHFDRPRPPGRPQTVSERYRTADQGVWALAVLTRVPVLGTEIADLGQMARDPARRAAIAIRLDVGGRAVTVVGTHMSHLSQGSLVQFGRLRRVLAAAWGTGPTAVAGDMNLWGPPLGALLPGWRRAVRGATWPAWSPHSQVDHILVRGGWSVLGAAVGTPAGSDHRPVRAALVLR